MGRPTLGDERNEILRRLVKELRDTDYDKNMSATARAIGVKPPTLSGFLDETKNKGAGDKITDGLRKLLGRGVDQMIASGGDLKALRGEKPMPSPASPQVTFGELPNWNALVAKASKLREHPAWVWEELAKAPVWLRGPMNAAKVAACADVVAEHVPPPDDSN